MDCGNRAGAFLQFKNREDGVLVKARLPPSLTCSNPSCVVFTPDCLTSIDCVSIGVLVLIKQFMAACICSF